MDRKHVIARYRSTGQKITPQRLAVLRVMEGNKSHPSAGSVVDQVHREHPFVSAATVYRVLGELTRMGELQTIPLDDGTVRFDPNTAGHAHLACRSCGRVDDVPWALDAGELPPGMRQGYALTSVQVVFHGRCPECRRAEEHAPDRDGDTAIGGAAGEGRGAGTFEGARGDGDAAVGTDLGSAPDRAAAADDDTRDRES